MMNDNTELIQQYGQKYPYLQTYMECMSRALLTGLSSFSLSFGGCYFAQHLLTKSLPYGIKGTIAISSTVAVLVSYRVTSVRTEICQAAWMAGEDKHTYLNPLSERTNSSAVHK